MNEEPTSKDMRITEFDQEGLKKIAKEIVLNRFFLILHVLIYAFVNILLFVINFLTDFNYPWYLWALTGWGILLLTHIFYYILYKKGIVHIATLLLLYHIWAFIILNLFMLFIDFFTATPRWTFASWFLFPLGAWGGLLLIHIVLYFYIIPSKEASDELTWIERKVERELKKLQKIKKENKKEQTE